jgi:hypothetical protein
MIVTIHNTRSGTSRGLKDGWIIAFSLHRQGLAGRSSGEEPPDLPFAGFSRRSGRFPALPYPPLKQMHLVAELNGVEGECFPFPFPWGSIDRERETLDNWRAGLS